MNLDLLAGALCGWVALAIFSLHIVSGPRHKTWATLPEYVRRGLLVTGAMFTWRSVNFFTVADSSVFLGHINAEGFLALVSVTYTVSALAWCVFSGILPDHAWERLQWAFKHTKDNPEAVPIMVPISQVPDLGQAVDKKDTPIVDIARLVESDG